MARGKTGSGGAAPTRRWVLGALGAGVAAPALAAPPTISPRPAPRDAGRADAAARALSAPGLDRLVRDARLGATAKVAVAVADLDSGAVLEGRTPLAPLPPASVAKAVTALYALDTLGPAHRFATRVHARGTITGGRLEGDLVLAGSGDPTLQTDGLAELAARVKAAGIVEVTGALRVWDGALPRIERIDPGQPDHVGYNPAVAGLNLNFNRVHFEWRRQGTGWDVTMDARSATHRPEVAVARMQVVDRAGPVYTYRDGGDVDEWSVAAGALGGSGARWLPVREPALYAGEVLAWFLRAQGIAVSGVARADAAPVGRALAEVRSGSLKPLLADMLDYSTNITAEAVGLSASAARGAAPETLAASGARMSAWLGGEIGGRRPDFVDHSGLGDQTRIAPWDMVRALVRLGPELDLPGILERIPVRDAQYRTMPDHPARVVAKTGTLNFVSGLAGYMRPLGGRDMAFAIFAADLPRRAAIPRARRDNADGAAGWARRARILQHRLIDRWTTLYGEVPPPGLRRRPVRRPAALAAGADGSGRRVR